jgi:plasmid stability protein
MRRLQTRKTARTGLTIRGLDPVIKARLRVRAAQKGRSMEQEVREILTETLAEPPATLAAVAQSLFGVGHGVELELPERSAGRDPPQLG